MSNWNFMLPGLVFEYEGVDGLKTGTTDFAGHSFTGTAKRNDTRLIAVVMKAVDSNGVGSYKARFDATAKLFDYGFGQFSKQELLAGNYTFEDAKTLPVTKGKADDVAIAVKEPISVMVKSNEKDLYVPTLTLNVDELEAEVEAGKVVGKVVVERTQGTDYGYIDGSDITADVITTEKVERAGSISLLFQGIGSFFGNLWNGIFGFVGGMF